MTSFYTFSLLLLVIVNASFLPIRNQQRPCTFLDHSSRVEYLYVWVGSDEGDHIAVIEYDPANVCSYGNIISKSYLPDVPNVSQTGNEAHHLGISGDGKWIITGGLVSLLMGTNEIFVWSIDENRMPVYNYSFDVPGYGCPDEFLPINEAKTLFIFTMMCDGSGGSPGSVWQINLSTGVWGPWLSPLNILVDFNPHGLDYSTKYGMISADYVLPITLFTGPPIIFRDTLRRFNLDGTLNATINMPTVNSGFMEFHYFPDEDSKYLGVSCGTNDNGFYLINTTDNTPLLLINLADAVNGGVKSLSAGLFRFTKTGNRLVTTFDLRYVVLLEISEDRRNASVIKVFDYCILYPQVCLQTGGKPGSHYLRFDVAEERFWVVNYFIEVGIAILNGTQTMSSFYAKRSGEEGEVNSFTLDPYFNPVFGKDRPHGAVEGLWTKVGNYWRFQTSPR